jgi:hypothetical protein
MSTTTPTPRLFPIQSQRGAAPHPLLIPWSVAEKAYSVYSAQFGRGQSLERLAERGGFGPGEMDMYVPGWRDECSEIVRLLASHAALVAACEAAIPFLESDRKMIVHSNTSCPQDESTLEEVARGWVAEIDAVLIPARAALALAREATP